MARIPNARTEGDSLAGASVITTYSRNIKKPHSNGENGAIATGSWTVIQDFAKKIEQERKEDITALFCDDSSIPDWWSGDRCECPVYFGENSIRLHTGEIVSLV